MSTSTYHLYVDDELSWEGITEKMTLEWFSGVKSRLENDLEILNLPRESKQSLHIVLHSFQNFMDAYQKMGPTTYSFVDLMRWKKSQMIGPGKWDAVKNKVSKENAISMFNFKDGPKRKMLKVQYFKHPNIAGHLYNIFLAAYEKFPWNDEVPHDFARHFYADFFMDMHPDYTSLPFDYYGVGKGNTYDKKWAYWNATLQRPPRPLISLLTRAFYSHSDLQASSEVGKEARNAIGKNLEASFDGVDVGMNRQRAKANSEAIFDYKTDAELDTMWEEDVLEYEIFF